MFFLTTLYWQFYMDAVGKDLSGLKSFDVEGEEVIVSEAEANIYAYLQTGHKIKVAYFGDVMCAFLIYLPVFESMYANKCLFVEKWARNLKLAKQLLNSVQKSHRILFKTLKDIPPKELLSHVGESRLIKIDEDEYMNTWLTKWEG